MQQWKVTTSCFIKIWIHQWYFIFTRNDNGEQHKNTFWGISRKHSMQCCNIDFPTFCKLIDQINAFCIVSNHIKHLLVSCEVEDSFDSCNSQSQLLKAWSVYTSLANILKRRAGLSESHFLRFRHFTGITCNKAMYYTCSLFNNSHFT